jgi:hypothetical protein
MSYREFLFRAVVSFCLVTAVTRFVLDEQWGSALIVGLIVGVIGPLGFAARRHRRQELTIQRRQEPDQ